jgi:glutamate-ammonia-ligase adenylyltransferase
VRSRLVDDFLERMDDDYFETFTPEEIAEHLHMSSAIDPEHQATVKIDALADGEFKIVIVGYDYASGFSILCGLLSAFGLDIRAGDVYSKREARGSSGRIVDVFRVALKPGESFDPDRQHEFAGELQALWNLLANNSLNDARDRLNRFLIERIERMGQGFVGLEAPIEFVFDNVSSSAWTLVEIRSTDTFGFLFAISNALAMRGIYIYRGKIRSSDEGATDQFLIANRWGRKIEDARDQQRLRMAVFMIKEFTRYLPEAPDPSRALRHFDQFLDKLLEISDDTFPDQAIEFLSSSPGMTMMANLLGSSDFLWDDLLLVHFSQLLPALEDFETWKIQHGSAFRANLRKRLNEHLEATHDIREKKKALNAFKDHHLFLIDAAHLLQPATLTDFSYALTDLAEVVIEGAAQISYERLEGKPQHPNAIFGLGKFGGREMGYASDLELLFVHESPDDSAFFESFAHSVVDLIETRSHGIFHIDLRLRPYGESGAWSTSFDQFVRYYSENGGAAPFERQALIKLRKVAGEDSLGRRVEAHRDSFTYSEARWNWADAMELRGRQMNELVKPGDINVKYSAGGIIDVEYAVQYLQLLNGAQHREIRVTGTLDALLGLRRLQIIREADYTTLYHGYLFLRNLIDSLRIVRGDATDLVLPDVMSEEFKSLARRLGYKDRDRERAAAKLAVDVRETMKKVHDYFITRFFTEPI